MADILAKQKALENILATDKAFLTPAEIAPILGVNPHSIRIAARQHPDSLKFDFIVSGNRTKIPRLPFLRYIGINIDNSPVQGSAAPVSGPLAGESMTGIDPLLIITQQISELKTEINKRFDGLEKQAQDLNDILLLAKNLIRALSEVPPGRLKEQ